MIRFELTSIEEERARKFRETHVCPYLEERKNEPFKGIPTLGERWYYKFVPSGLGPEVEIGCIFCGAHEHITDVENW